MKCDMSIPNQSVNIFFSLLRAGLWEHPVSLAPYGTVDWSEILHLSKEQTVVGLVAAGLEYVQDVEVPEDNAVEFAHWAMKIEGRNGKMNAFLSRQATELADAGITTVLMKGQGIAQCYERPSWRSSGDIDWFFLDDYERAKELLSQMADSTEQEFSYLSHLGMKFGSVDVELHGSVRARLSRRMDRVLDQLYSAMFSSRDFRYWSCGGVPVAMPGPNYDAVFLFTHILHHYYVEGIGLRQLCDWCRFLWTYRDELDPEWLAARLRELGVMEEWQAFASFVVRYLGLPSETMPLYKPSSRADRQADRILQYVLTVGNFGHNKDKSYLDGKPWMVRKFLIMSHRLSDFAGHLRTFPRPTLRILPYSLYLSLHSSLKGEA